MATQTATKSLCFGTDLPEHEETCACGATATHHANWITGCGNVCNKCLKKLLRRKPNAQYHSLKGQKA